MTRRVGLQQWQEFWDPDAAVQTFRLSKVFGEERAVDQVTLRVPRGLIFGFVGPSGCGKTTTIRLLNGHYRPTEGEARVLRRSPTDFGVAEKLRIGYMPQQSVLYRELSVWHNLRFASSVYGVGPRHRDRLLKLLEFVKLSEHLDKRVSQISGGMRRRLSLASTLAHDPELLFLDEPTAGIDPVLRRSFWEYFRELQREERTLFVTTQYVGEAAYCDLVGIMIAGRLLVVDTPQGLRRRAFGGDVLDLRLDHDLGPETETGLRELACVRHLEHRAPHRYRIVVDEGATATPRLVEWLGANEARLVSLDEILAPFDDVFVQLVEDANGG